MKVAILRRSPGISYSMDVYADALVSGLRDVRPQWEISEYAPTNPTRENRTNSLLQGTRKYYHRYWEYPKALRRQAVDVFHIIDHSDGYLVSHLLKTSIPVVVTCHDIINLVNPEAFKDKARFSWLSMATWKKSLREMCNADRIIADSEHTARDVIEYLPIRDGKQICTVPLGVDSAFKLLSLALSESYRVDLGIPQKSCCIINVGSNNPRKNVASILRAVSSLNKNGLPVYFCKVGADFTSEQKQFIDENQIQRVVSYLGKPSQDELVKIYNAADILVSPSTHEGFGLTVLEAMSCGLPVIAGNVTSLPEVVGQAGILIDPLNVSELCDSIRKIYKDTHFRENLVQAGLLRAQQFTWQNTAEQVAQVYESLVHKNQRRFTVKAAEITV